MTDDAKPKKRRTRRGVLTPETMGLLLEHLKRGVFRTNACALIGVSHSAVEAWMRKGREELADACEEMDATGKMPALSRYGELVIAVEAIEAEVEASMVGIVVRVAKLIEPEVCKSVSADGTESTVVLTPANPEAAFKAATWWLERKKHLVYGRGALRVDLGPSSSTGDEDEDPVDVFLDKLAAVEKNLRAVKGEAPSSADKPADETHE